MSRVLFLRRYYRNAGALSLLFFGGMMVLSVYAALAECPEGRKIYAVCLFVGTWGFFAVLAFWMLLAYGRESLRIKDGKIVQKGVVRTREMNLSEVVDVRWGGTPMGRIFVRSTSDRIKVALENYEPEERLWLVRLLRSSLPRSIQRDWERFCLRVALPLVKSGSDRPLSEDEVLVTRRRCDWFFLPAVLLCTLVGGFCAWYLRQPQCLLFPVPVAGIWLLMRFSTPRKGYRSQRLSKMPERGLMLFVLIAAAVVVAASALDRFVSPHLPHPAIWSVTVCVLFFIVILFQASRFDRARHHREEPMVAAAAEEWERFEAAQEQSAESRKPP